MAYGIARERLNYVYLGNVGDREGSDTDCPACGQTLIVRRGYRVSITGLKGSRCRNCGERIPVVGLPEE